MHYNLLFILAVTAALLLSAASAQCPQHSWTHRAHSCYKWFSQPQYWFEAEQTCLSQRAHLASIGSEQENRLVGRLSHCRDAWIGKFGTDLNRLTDPRAYAWTDGSVALSFERHNFSQLDTVHKPLIRSDGEWWLNSLYHEKHPFVCKASTNSSHESSRRCPRGWSLKDDHCYVMPHFEANFNEANFYCQRNSSQLVSVLTNSELSFINELTFGIDGCAKSPALDSVWLGLIKLNPCFPDSGGRELCYQWTDFSGKLASIPQWEAGHPNNADWTVNCVTLSAGRLRSDRCYNRHRFVCKSLASNDTDGGVTPPPPPVEGLVAAFDFRRSLDNLVDWRTYVIEDKFGVERNSADGAVFKYNQANKERSEFYSVGGVVPYSESISNATEWAMYFRLRHMNGSNALFAGSINFNFSGPLYESDSYSLYTIIDNQKASEAQLGVYHYSPRNSSHHNFHNHYHYFSGNRCSGSSWCDIRFSLKNRACNSTIGGEPRYKNYWDGVSSNKMIFEFQQLRIGNFYWNRYYPDPGLRIACFGIAVRQLTDKELQQAMSFYCP